MVLRLVQLGSFLILAVTMAACGGRAQVELPTVAVLPTDTATPLPSDTPPPTYTPFPSLTPLPSSTPLPTLTPVPTVSGDQQVVIVPAGACEDMVETALNTADQICTGLAGNSMCYGNATIQSVLTDVSVTFAEPGNQVPVNVIQQLNLAALDVVAGDWGVAVANVQANLPDTLPGQLVKILLYGNTEIQNDSGDMTVIRFRTGIGTPNCLDIPDGMVIQTPPDAGSVQFTVNGVGVELGSTAHFSAIPGGDLTISMLEGRAMVTANGESETVLGGEFVTVPMDLNLQPLAPPSDPEPLDRQSAVMVQIQENAGIPVPAVSTTGLNIVTDSGDIEGDIWQYATTGLPVTTCPVSVNVIEMVQGDGFLFDQNPTGRLDLSSPMRAEDFFNAIPADQITTSAPSDEQVTATISVQDGASIEYVFTKVSDEQIDVELTVAIQIATIDCSFTQNGVLTKTS